MRQEIENWWKQALADKRKADVLFDTSNYDGAVFYYHQTVEKALKGLCMKEKGEFPQGHSIIHLAVLLGLPKGMLPSIRDLNPEYLITRYPDMAGGIPSEIYDKENSSRHRKTAEEVVKWVGSRIEK